MKLMKAKMGKASIGCFGVSLLTGAVLVYWNWEAITAYENCPICEGPCMDPLLFGFWDAVGVFSLLLVPVILLGVVLAVLGVWKKESPKTYWRFGLVLNSAWMVFAAGSLLWHKIF